MIVTDRLLSLREAAALIGVSPDTARRYVKDGLLPAVRVGPQGMFRVRPDDVRRLGRPVATAHR